MVRLKIGEFRDHLSRFLKRVEAGEEFEIRRRDRAIARVVPVRTETTSLLRPARRPFDETKTVRAGTGPWPTDVLDVLDDVRNNRA